VSKIADWGRWLVAANQAIWGAVLVRGDIDRGELLFWIIAQSAFIFALVRAVLIWSRWAHAFLLVGGIVGIPLAAYLVLSGKAAEYGIPLLSLRWILGNILWFATLVWLLLPSVRAVYWHKAQIA